MPTLPADVTKVMHDHVATTTINREWVVPGVNDADTDQLAIAAAVLGGLESSRLNNDLVKRDKLAVSVSANVQTFEKISFFNVSAIVRDGVDPALVGQKLDAEIADFIKTGPTADEVQRAATSAVSGTINGLEQVGGFGGKAVTLAEGAVYSNDPDKYKKDLAELAAATPASVSAATRKWLNRPVLRLTMAPGERSAEDIATAGSQTAVHAPLLLPPPRRMAARGRRGMLPPPRRASAAAAAAQPKIAAAAGPAGRGPHLPRDRARDLVERHQGDLRAPQCGADGAARGLVRCRQRRRRQGEARHAGA